MIAASARAPDRGQDRSWTGAILAFWFGLAEERHWARDDALDAEIRRRFETLWDERREMSPGAFLGSPDEALAAILLFDQFPRNMFRDDARAFATDPLARAIADQALARDYDRAVARERRHFFYLPFEHSEAAGDQERSVALFRALGDQRYLDFARKHRDVIARFGRFPHRNRLLGRRSTPEERAFGLEPPW